MTDDSYAVDSATRSCCGGIGTHTRQCNASPHGCGFDWCTQPASSCSYEHVGSGEIQIGDHSRDIEAVAAYAFVTAEPGGKVYDDEIVLNVYGRNHEELALISLTDHEAAQIRDMLDRAISHRAQVRSPRPAGESR